MNIEVCGRHVGKIPAPTGAYSLMLVHIIMSRRLYSGYFSAQFAYSGKATLFLAAQEILSSRAGRAEHLFEDVYVFECRLDLQHETKKFG